MRPGLWMRPLCGAHDDGKECIVSFYSRPRQSTLPGTRPNDRGKYGAHPLQYFQLRRLGLRNGKARFQHLRPVRQGGFQMTENITTNGWHFNDRSKTNAQIILDLYLAIRNEGRNMYLIGCNTVSHLSAGIFELNRIGDDTSGKEWERTRKMGVNTLASAWCSIIILRCRWRLRGPDHCHSME